MNGHFALDSNGRLGATIRQVASFAAIGVASTLAYVGIYAWLRQVAPAVVANAVALALTAIGNMAANRRLTFSVRGRRGLTRDLAAGLVALGVALVITTAGVAAMDVFAPHRGRLGEIAVLVAANAIATIVPFLLLRLAIDSRGGFLSPAPALATLSTLAWTHR
jgi:putative flippase GtrA